MKNVYRLLAASALTVAALLFTPAPSQSQSMCLWNCQQIGYCLRCVDPCSGTCTISCRYPGGGGYDDEC